MELDELDELFEDPANRRWGVFYHCAADPRVIAPSRPTWRGYQINFAHPRAVRVLLLYLSVLVGPVSLAFAFGPRHVGRLTVLASAVFAVSAGFLIALSSHLSKRLTSPRPGRAAATGRAAERAAIGQRDVSAIGEESIPAVIRGGRVVLYSRIDGRHQPTGVGWQILHGERIFGPAWGVAICAAADGRDFALIACGPDWIPIADTRHATLEEAKSQAEFQYEGLESTWRVPAS